MKTNSLRIFLLLAIITACKHDSTVDLTVIQNLKLGVALPAFYKACDSVGLSHQNFVDKPMYTSSINCKDNSVNAYFTKQFNTGPWGGSGSPHVGLFYTHTMSGNNIVGGLSVLLGYEATTYFFDTPPSSKINHGVKTLIQDVNEELLKEIKAQLIQKYGRPKDSLKGNSISFYIILGNKIENKTQGNNYDGVLYIWETPSIEVRFFTGIIIDRSAFKLKSGGYEVSLSNDYKADILKGETACRSFSYIEYVIKDEVMTKLKLDTPNL